MCKFIPKLLGINTEPTVVQQVSAPTAAEAPAASQSAPTSGPESTVDSSGETLKRKSKGKQGLTITPTSTGGSTAAAGGTGLNL